MASPHPSPKTRILDGGMGVLLPKLGMPKDLTIWSARAIVQKNLNPLVLRAHREFIEAGASAIIVNCYSINPTHLKKAGLVDQAKELCAQAAQLAREAAGPRGDGVIVIGSLPPLSESYRPDMLLPDSEAVAWYSMMCHAMEPSVDFFVCETMSCPAEAVNALRGLERACPEAKAWVSFSVTSSGCCRDGTPFNEAVKQMSAFGSIVTGVGVNCCVPEAVELAFRKLDTDEEAYRFAEGIERVGYANAFPASLNEGVSFETESFDDEGVRSDLGADRYAEMALEWATRPRLPLTVIGGCCGILPEHIKKVAEKLT